MASPSPAATAAPALTEEQAAKAFDLWETRFRADPGSFLTHEESARMALVDAGTSRAIYFLALLREVMA